MEDKKLCKDCKGRVKGGWCVSAEKFVPKKQTVMEVNVATTCDHFKKK